MMDGSEIKKFYEKLMNVPPKSWICIIRTFGRCLKEGVDKVERD